MKIAAALLMFAALFLPNTFAEDYTQWGLPEGAVARIGKGSIRVIRFSPDLARIAISSTTGVWLYDTATGQEIALLSGHPSSVYKIAFSPDGTTLASGSSDSLYLWDVFTGEHKGTLITPSGTVGELAFSSGRHDACQQRYSVG